MTGGGDARSGPGARHGRRWHARDGRARGPRRRRRDRRHRPPACLTALGAGGRTAGEHPGLRPVARRAGRGVLGRGRPRAVRLRQGVAFFAGVGKFESLYGTDVGQELRAGLPGPAGSVRFLNDADAFLLGEWLFGAAAGHDPCAAITLGTGVGSAFLSGGVVRQDGPGVPPEGRVDLLRIDGRPWKTSFPLGRSSVGYQHLSGVNPQGAVQVAGLARGGDPVAAGVLRSAFAALGKALSPWLEEFGAEALVVGGSMTGSWDLIGPALVGGIGAAMKRRGQNTEGTWSPPTLSTPPFSVPGPTPAVGWAARPSGLRRRRSTGQPGQSPPGP